MGRVRIVSIAQNVPGPVAVRRLVDAGATAIKIEPPSGDQLERICKPWYDDLHAGVRVERIDLKTTNGFGRLRTLIETTDVFLSSQRPSALARLGADAATLHRDHPQLRCVNIVGNTANPEEPGHDLTYQAQAGLIARSMPLTLIGDMVGAERAFAAINEAMHTPGATRVVGLFDALHDLAAPLRYGLTAAGGWLGGGNPAYAIYPARQGAVAVAALEPHFRSRLYEGLGLPDGADPSEVFLTRPADEWEQWAKQHDLPLVAIG
jgi:crotonobetainyl-CoA:carnitine CoA-transferase CaiB-like acyl-CoA transferase